MTGSSSPAFKILSSGQLEYDLLSAIYNSDSPPRVFKTNRGRNGAIPFNIGQSSVGGGYQEVLTREKMS